MWIRRAIAVVLFLVGVVWVLQGIGLLEGSFMTGEIVWAFIGAVCIGVGADSIDAQPARTRRYARTHLLAYSGGRTLPAVNSLGRRTFFRLLRTSSDAIRPTRRRAPRRTRP